MPKLARKTINNVKKKLLSVESNVSLDTRSFNTFRTDQSARHYFTIEVRIRFRANFIDLSDEMLLLNRKLQRSSKNTQKSALSTSSKKYITIWWTTWLSSEQ